MDPPNGDDHGGGESGDAPAVEIERVAPGEVDEVVEAWVDLAAGQRAHGSHVLPEPNRSAVRDTLARQAVTGGVRAARDDGDVVGFVSFAPERGAYESDVTRGIVHNIYVDPDRRGDGIGAALLAAAETALGDDGASTVALEAMADNESALRFYRRQGYDAHRVELEKSIDGGEGTDAAAGENDTHSKEG